MTYTRPRTPVPGGVSGFRVISYATSTVEPCGISLDRKTLYGGNSSGALLQSVDDGITWTTVKASGFGGKIGVLFETDDGEAICCSTNGASTPS